MKIVIDLQCLQGPNCYRGIGRYSLSLSQSLLRYSKNHEFYLLLNNKVENIEFIRNSFTNLIQDEFIKIFEIPKKNLDSINNNEFLSKSAEKIREQFIANISPDIVFISSMFEGWKDGDPLSIGELEPNIITASTLYDLIPFIYSNEYIKDEKTRNFIFRKMQYLKKSNLLITISNSSLVEAKEILSLDDNQIINCSLGIDSIFKINKYTQLEVLDFRKKYGINKKFIFYVGGIDFRKNITGLIEAYSYLPSFIKTDYQLIIIVSDVFSSVEPYLNLYSKRYNLEKNQLILLNKVPEEELIKLYNLCSLFIFPSFYEGFGLPILEAMACGAITICSNTSSMPEAIGNRDALFNPKVSSEITKKMFDALTNEDFGISLKRHAKNHITNFTWENTAKKVLSTFENSVKISNNTKQNFMLNYKKKMAFISPLPPEATGLSDYSAQLLPNLSHYYDITLIINQKIVKDDWLEATFPIQNVEWFIKYNANFDIILYQFGNSNFHYYMLKLLKLFPGVVVLHDFFLSGLYNWIDIFVPNEKGILSRALYYSHGFKSLLKQKKGNRQLIIDNYPCNLYVLKRSLGIIVLSQHTINLAKKWYGNNITKKFKLINHVAYVNKNLDQEIKNINKEKLGFKKDDFLISSFGFIGESKLYHRIIEAISNSSLSKNKFYIIFVGGNYDDNYNSVLFKLIKESNLSTNVKFTGFCDPEMFKSYLLATDIAIQLRSKSRGETSGCVFKCLSYGIPTIINAHGSLNEIPEDIVLKIKDKFDNQDLINKVNLLFKNNKLRNTLSKNALNYIKKWHNSAKIAKQYYNAIEDLYINDHNFREQHLIKNLINSNLQKLFNKADLFAIASAICTNRLPLNNPKILIDISSININYNGSSVPSNIIGLLKSLLTISLQNLRTETIYYNNLINKYCYANNFATNILNLENKLFDGLPIQIFSQDKLIIMTSIFNKIYYNSCLNVLNAKGIKIFYLIANGFQLGNNVASEQDLIIFQSNYDELSKFNSGFICIGNETFDLFVSYLSKSINYKNKIVKIAKICSIDYSIIIERLNEIIFYDKWDINLNSNHDSTLNSFLEKDSFSQTSPMAL